MSCHKESLTNPHCQACRIKAVVQPQGRQLELSKAQKGLVRWKRLSGNAWTSTPSGETAHCAKGIPIVVA